MATLSIIIPVYNEERYIVAVLEKIKGTVLSHSIEKEVIVVNDNSSDLTEERILHYRNQAASLDFQYIKHSNNKGKGASISTGLQHATGAFVIVQDADLEYDPQDYNALLNPLVKDLADVVYGSRFVGDKPHRVLFFWHYLGNRFLTLLSNAFTNLNLTDMETCYKLFKTEIIKGIRLKENRYGFEPEITAKIAKIPDIRIYEVGISYYGRTYKEGKKINWKDGLRAVYCILKYNLFR
jgi:glycosyltransferase involved in cell wall biosynthesis